MRKSVRLGICQWSLPIDGPYGCKVAKELGLDGIQLDVGTFDRGFPLSKKSVQNAFLEMAKQYEIKFPSIAITELDYFSMVAPDGSSERLVADMAVRKAIESAQAMEIPLVMAPSFGKSMINTDQDMAEAVSYLQFACDYAKPFGITVATENALSATRIEEMFERVNRENLKLYFDSQNHFLQKGYDIADLLKEVYPFVCEVHLKDGKEGNLSASLLGQGETGFYRTMDVLREKTYSGWLVLENYYDREPLSLQANDPLDLVSKDLEILKSVL